MPRASKMEATSDSGSWGPAFGRGARGGMTRKALAEQSGISLRFPNEVKAGRRNLSLNSLEYIARALNIQLLDLMQESPRPALARVVDMVDGLDEADLGRLCRRRTDRSLEYRTAENP